MSRLEAHGSSFATSVEEHDHEQIEFCFDYALGSTPGASSCQIDAYGHDDDPFTYLAEWPPDLP